MKYIFLLLFMLNLSYVNAQSPNNPNPQLTSTLPPSPNVSALNKFGSIPIGPSTGIPSIAVPVYSYSNKTSNLSLSVSLDYHAGGVRVDEVASDVGLGWALNAGGCVSRILRGLPDESEGGFLNTPYFDGSEGNDHNTERFKKAYASVLVDIEADIFSFNFNGRSGKFTYGRNGDILILNDQKLKIEREGAHSITKFTITDENGIKYIFSSVEVPSGGTADLVPHNSAWYLTEIKSASGQDKILFEYESSSIPAYTVSVSETIVSNMPPYYGSPSTTSPSLTGFYVQKRIKKVSFPDGVYLTFDYQALERQDLPGDHLLSKITIKDVLGQTARGFELEQDYSLNRATLIKIYPFAGISIPVKDIPYQFFYNTGLPARLSQDQDHWGYPRGTVVGGRIPREMVTGIPGVTELPGSDRETDQNCVAGTINKIIYPTGGRTEFELEPNRAFDVILNAQRYVGGLRAKKITDYDGISTLPASIKEYEYLTEGGSTSGILASYPTYTSTAYYQVLTALIGSSWSYSTNPPNVIIRKSSSMQDIVYTNGSPVTYSRVVEYQKNSAGQSNGKIERFFTTNGSAGSYRGFPYTPAENLWWLYGLLKKELIYNANGQLIKMTENTYQDKLFPNYSNTPAANNFTSYSIAPVMFYNPNYNYGTIPMQIPSGDPLWFIYNYYLPHAGRSDLLSTTVTDYDLELVQATVQSSSFEYDSFNYNLKKKTYTDSRGLTVTETNSYPADMVSSGTSGPYQQMVDKNIISPVIEQKKLVNGVLSLQRTNYVQPFTDLYVPGTVDVKNTVSGVNETRLRYSRYDLKGNILSAMQENGAPVSYIYSYNKQYPVAEIKNTDYASIENILTPSAIEAFSIQVSPDKTAIDNFLAPLKTNIPQAFVKSLSYQPLIGMTSQTDAKGMTVYYEYDSFQRLKAVRDQNNNIIKTYCYNYAGQVTDCNAGGGSSAPTHVYARIEVLNPTWGAPVDGSTTEADIYLALYSDAACTHPVSVPQGFDVYVGTTGTYFENSMSSVSSWTNSYGVPANTDRVLLGRYVTDSWYSYYDPYYGQMINSYNYTYQVEDNGMGVYIPAATY